MLLELTSAMKCVGDLESNHWNHMICIQFFLRSSMYFQLSYVYCAFKHQCNCCCTIYTNSTLNIQNSSLYALNWWSFYVWRQFPSVFIYCVLNEMIEKHVCIMTENSLTVRKSRFNYFMFSVRLMGARMCENALYVVVVRHSCVHYIVIFHFFMFALLLINRKKAIKIHANSDKIVYLWFKAVGMWLFI